MLQKYIYQGNLTERDATDIPVLMGELRYGVYDHRCANTLCFYLTFQHKASSYVLIYSLFILYLLFCDGISKLELVDTYFSYVCNTTFSSRLFIKRSRVNMGYDKITDSTITS